MKHGFAIIRLDLFQTDIEDQVVGKRLMWDQTKAKAEVERLNVLNGDKECKYILVPIRVDEG